MMLSTVRTNPCFETLVFILLVAVLQLSSTTRQVQAWVSIPSAKSMAKESPSRKLQDDATKRLTTCSTFTSTTLHQALIPAGGLQPCRIQVIGVGGGGCNAVDRMMDTMVQGVEFYALNTDAQALGRSRVKGAETLNIGGKDVTRGLGAGGRPSQGRAAAEESRDEIRQIVQGTDLCFVTAGMGGGTGSGAAPIVAELAKDAGCLTVGIVTKPFRFEGVTRMRQAEAAIAELRKNVDTIIVVNNNRLLEIVPKGTPMEKAFRMADDILRQGVVGISDIIVSPGLVNVDFADVRSVMSNAGTAMMGIGVANGKQAPEQAAMAAISSPLLDTSIDNAKGVVFNVCGGNLTLSQVNRAAETIYKYVDPEAQIIFGALMDATMPSDQISITVLAAGFDEDNLKPPPALPESVFSTVGAAAAEAAEVPVPSAATGAPVKESSEPRRRRRRGAQQVEQEDDRKAASSSSTDEKQGRGGSPGDPPIPDFLRKLKRTR